MIESLSEENKKLYHKATILRQKKKFSEAINIYKTLSESNVNNDIINYYLAACFYDIGDHRSSVNPMRLAVNANPNNVHYRVLFGNYLNNAKNYHEALRQYDIAINLDPNYYNSYHSANMLLFKQNRIDEAVTYGLKVLKIKDKIEGKRFKEKYKSKYELKKKKSLNLENFFKIEKKKNIIAFSLYGNNPMYTRGAIENILLAQYIYPNWTCRFYYDETVPKKIIQSIKKMNAEVILMPKNQFSSGLLWRFFVSDDPSIDFFIVRDVDARINPQERIAVDQWIESGKNFHIIRDHPVHTELIHSGLWGGRSQMLPNLKNVLDNEYSDQKKVHFFDQQFLREFVWPLIKNDAITHDAYFKFGTQVKETSKFGNLKRPTHIGGGFKNINKYYSPFENLLLEKDEVPSHNKISVARITTSQDLKFITKNNDPYISKSLEIYGEWSYGEIEFLSKILNDTDNLVEAGANIGSHTVFLARHILQKGKVFAFEPRRLFFQTLCGNLSLNDIENVTAYDFGLGDKFEYFSEGNIDFSSNNNFGAYPIGTIPGEGEKIKIEKLDNIIKSNIRISLIKADVEGHELKLLLGAKELIKRDRPYLYLENERVEYSKNLLTYILDLEYNIWFHVVPLFNPNNRSNTSYNIFPNIKSFNIICSPKEKGYNFENLKKVTDPEYHPLKR